MAIQEVDKYLQDTPIERSENPLLWWKDHQRVYPNLAHLVRTRSVSYTHLQNKTTLLITINMINVTQETLPVSYTHLDVYKRQVSLKVISCSY